MRNSKDTPILPGFHPDPSICRVGDTYYMAVSSFEYRPGVPLFSSTDLINWTPIGHVLTRPSQFPEGGTASGGIYAPTLRHHAGRFWMVTTNVTQPRSEQILCWAERPEGPWSDTVMTRGMGGIDPDLTWDGDDCYLTWTTSDPADPAILQARFEPETATALEDVRVIWRGTGLAFPEAPHFYFKDGWWYLLLAEGGTERGHSITMARSRSITGPFDPAPNNPVFSHRSLFHPVQNTGHGDLFQMADGGWAMVYLGVRPRGTSPGFHVNGRETFIARVDWSGDWPVMYEDGFDIPEIDRSFVDGFVGGELHTRWISPYVYPSSHVEFRRDGGLAISPAGEGSGLFFRAMDLHWSAEFDLELPNGQGAALVRMDDAHQLRVEISGGEVAAIAKLGDLRVPIGKATLSDTGRLKIKFQSISSSSVGFMPLEGPDLLTVSIQDGGRDIPLGQLDGRFLSTEVAGGFTGRMIGVIPVDTPILLHEATYRAVL